jgi:NAD(P)-dependent dehydrogenase (short-subunit alcohol dehydrogenase family)
LAVDLNLRTVLVTTEAAIPQLRARGGGSLLFTASTSGLQGSVFSPVYSAVKFGVVGFVRSLAVNTDRNFLGSAGRKFLSWRDSYGAD